VLSFEFLIHPPARVSRARRFIGKFERQKETPFQKWKGARSLKTKN